MKDVSFPFFFCPLSLLTIFSMFQRRGVTGAPFYDKEN
jgi:hypothetical protein